MTATLKRGWVWRLCVGCDRRLQKGRAEVGPFLCGGCRKSDETLGHHHPDGNCIPKGIPECPAWLGTLDRLGELYEAVERFPTESAARAAGLPTTLREFIPLLPTRRPHATTNQIGRTEAELEDED